MVKDTEDELLSFHQEVKRFQKEWTCWHSTNRCSTVCFKLQVKSVYSTSERGNIFFSVGCLWHSHGKNPVRLYPKLQSQPIGLPKIFIGYLFLEADQSDFTKSVSISNRFVSSEERWNKNFPWQICRARVFPLVVWDGLLTSEILRDTGKSERRPKPNYFFSSWFFFV